MSRRPGWGIPAQRASLETTVIIHLQANTGPVLVPGALEDPCGASQAGVPAVTAHGVEPLLHTIISLTHGWVEVQVYQSP